MTEEKAGFTSETLDEEQIALCGICRLPESVRFSEKKRVAEYF